MMWLCHFPVTRPSIAETGEIDAAAVRARRQACEFRRGRPFQRRAGRPEGLVTGALSFGSVFFRGKENEQPLRKFPSWRAETSPGAPQEVADIDQNEYVQINFIFGCIIFDRQSPSDHHRNLPLHATLTICRTIAILQAVVKECGQDFGQYLKHKCKG